MILHKGETGDERTEGEVKIGKREMSKRRKEGWKAEFVVGGY